MVMSALLSFAMSAGVLAGQLESLGWLAGCWANVRGDAGSAEHWMPLAGGTMLGVARTIKDGKTVDFEFLRLHEDESGTAVYTATPAGQKETRFVAVHVDATGARFENPAHDFPTRIIYSRAGDAGMVVRIEGMRQGQPRGIDFGFTRVACPR